MMDNTGFGWFTATSKQYQEQADKLGVPLILPIDPLPKPHETNPTVAICGACGLHLKQVMCYLCSNANCPTGLGGPKVSLGGCCQ